jgi:alkylation response protein AidB-like acyl-CoA dehydrogenase|eukprot:g5887.t1
MLRTIGRAEVLLHNTTEDLWVIIDGYVYDLSKFKDLHPGGAPPLKFVAGKDASDAFYGLHRSSILKEKRFERLRVGRVAGYTPPPTPPPTPYSEPLFIRKHSPYYNDSHHKLRRDVRAFIDEHIAPTAADDDEFGEDPSMELNVAMGNAGILAAIVGPEAAQLGFKPIGMESFENFDYFHDMVIAEEFKRLGTYGLSDGLVGGLSIGLPVILTFGSRSLKERVGIPCLNGTKRIALAISEPYAGSDVARIQTQARLSPDGKHYIVSGVKKWITGGRFADFFTTLTVTEKGYVLMVIERDTGAVTTKPIKTSYSSAAGTAYVEFNDALVPVENVVGEVGKGFNYTMYNFNHERWGMCVGGNRMSRMMLEEAFKWATQRKIFKKRLIDQPVIRYKLAQMAADIECVHSMIEDMTYQMCNMSVAEINQSLAGPIALLKYKQTRVATLVADQVCQIFGGRALTRTGMGKFVEKFQRSYKMQAILGGSEEIMADLAIRQAMKGAGSHPAML